MNRERPDGYTIELADTPERYEGLRGLWQRVFGDEPGFVDAVYETFGLSDCREMIPLEEEPEIAGYVVCDAAGKTVSALTCYRCGIMRGAEPLQDPADPINEECIDSSGDEAAAGSRGRPVYVSYAICTDSEYRGLGLGQALTAYVRYIVTGELGAISLVSPAEESLEGYYENLGYARGFYIEEHRAGRMERYGTRNVDGCDPDEAEEKWDSSDAEFESWLGKEEGSEEDDFSPLEPELTVEHITPSVYNMYRESFLIGKAHVELSSGMAKLAGMCSAGGQGLLLINRGDAICALGEADNTGTSECDDAGGDNPIHTAFADELLINPRLAELSEEIGEEIAAALAGHLGADELIYRTPGCGRCQAMYAAADDIPIEGYYGFPIE